MEERKDKRDREITKTFGKNLPVYHTRVANQKLSISRQIINFVLTRHLIVIYGNGAIHSAFQFVTYICKIDSDTHHCVYTVFYQGC